MLTLTFLGVGSAYAKRNFNSNALVEAWSAGFDRQPAPDDNLLIDFGTTGPLALYQLKDKPGFEYLRRGSQTNWAAIRRIFVTHQHSDHVGGLEELAGCNVHADHPPDVPPFKPQLLAEAGVMEALWSESLKGGLGVLNGRLARLKDYFDVCRLRLRAGQPAFTLLDRYRFRVFPTDHIRVCQPYDWPSFGLYITDARTGGSAFYSGDTRFDPDSYAQMLADASICFHEVQLTDDPEPVHTGIGQLRSLAADIRAKTWLYHYGDNWDDASFEGVSREFAGFAKPHHRYILCE